MITDLSSGPTPWFTTHLFSLFSNVHTCFHHDTSESHLSVSLVIFHPARTHTHSVQQHLWLIRSGTGPDCKIFMKTHLRITKGCFSLRPEVSFRSCRPHARSAPVASGIDSHTAQGDPRFFTGGKTWERKRGHGKGEEREKGHEMSQ